MGVKYRRARSVAASKGWAKAGLAAAGSTRASRARAAAVAARRGSLRSRSAKRRIVRGARPGALASQSVGAAKFLVAQHSPPPMPKLYSSLRNLGVPVPDWHLFQSNERFHIEPKSGHCHWGGVPFHLIQGTVKVSPTTNTDYMPANCDLFDCAAKLVQNTNDNGLVYYRPFPWVQTSAAEATLDDGFNQTSTQTQSLSSTFGSSPSQSYHRRFCVAKNKVMITMENVSTLDAFIEEYELTYTQPIVGNTFLTGNTTAVSLPNLSIGVGVDAYFASSLSSSLYKNAPRIFSVRQGLPYYKEVYPDNLVTLYDVRKYGLRMAGQMLESYANIALNHRANQALMDPSEMLNTIRTSEVTTTVRRATIPEVLSHPLNDPTKIFPRGVKNKTGFSLRKLPGLITLKPGASKRVYLPVKNQFNLDVDSFPRGIDIEADQNTTTSTFSNANYRDVVSLPKTMKIRFFRVRGDMIMNSAKADSLGDADYQTGSCRVMFQVMRSFYMQHQFQLAPKVGDPLHMFDDGVDEDIGVANQEAINDETDAPAAVNAAGN